MKRKITAIVIHCTAGFGNKKSVEAFWKSQGWKSPGYHLLIDQLGVVHELLNFDKPSNGVKGHNANTIHISYIGGVEIGPKNTKGETTFIAKDTRTVEQKCAILYCIDIAQKYAGYNVPIKGHRDFSPDQNHDGIIASWERIKECPSFDAIPEYKHLIKPV